MQPNPIADTSRPLLPNFRVFIFVSPLEHLSHPTQYFLRLA
jgi:hypothetical protein